MKRSRIFAGLIALAVLSAAAAHAAKRPAWTQGEDPAYPNATYVTGVGIGDDLDAARSNARAEISKVFQARVQQVTSDVQSETSGAVGGKRSPVESAQESEMRTKVTTESLLEGVQISQTWFDKKKKKHYALAVLSRPKTLAALSGQITEKEEGIGAQMSIGKAAPSAIEKARAYAQAYRLAQERDALAARRRAVDPVTVPDLPGTGNSTAEAENLLRQTLAQIQFTVEADGETPSRLKESVTGKITAMGFKVLDSTAPAATPMSPVIKIKCRLTIEPFDRGNPSWKFFRWNGAFEMAESGKNGRVLASSTPAGAEGHLTEDTARTKTRISGEEALAKEAETQIGRYILGK
ncbi:MAG TPA: LPP20 family lipoprotein [Elusimicrobiota bacterium]|nr:LPP20 family lipoprotein [Elusimicrobiota bacterium]